MKNPVVNTLILATVSLAEPAMENELAFGTSTDSFAPDAEWTLVVEQGTGPGTLSVENVLYQPFVEETPENWTGEATLTYGISPMEWIELSAGARLGYGTASPTPWSLAIISPSLVWESVGLEIADDNELAWDFRNKSTHYTNTLGLFQPMGTASNMDIAFEAEYEGTIEWKKGSQWVDGLEAGISLSKQNFGLSLFWTTAIRPETFHGVKVVLAHSL